MNGTRIIESPLESVAVRRKPSGGLLDTHSVTGRIAPFRYLFCIDPFPALAYQRLATDVTTTSERNHATTDKQQ
jgi:hypothetical protein